LYTLGNTLALQPIWRCILIRVALPVFAQAALGHGLPEHAVNPSLGARLRPSLAADGSGSPWPKTALDLQRNVENEFFEVQLKVGRQGWGIAFRNLWSVLTRVPGPETSEDCLSPAGASSAAPVRVRGAAELFRKAIPQTCPAQWQRVHFTERRAGFTTGKRGRHAPKPPDAILRSFMKGQALY